MMIEGGRIDHACHANDVSGSIMDTLAFDEAVEVAMDFYNDHPDETLVLVVGDHETGGMGLGFGKNYFLNMDELMDIKISVADTLQGKYTGDREAYFDYVEANMGLDNLTAEEQAEIEEAMDIVDNEVDPGNVYGGYDPVAIAVTHVVSERANFYWTTYAHSGTAIPLSAVGVGAASFGGYKDNTEIAETMADLMGFTLTTAGLSAHSPVSLAR
jgi:alkaline phosphatase